MYWRLELYMSPDKVRKMVGLFSIIAIITISSTLLGENKNIDKYNDNSQLNNHNESYITQDEYYMKYGNTYYGYEYDELNEDILRNILEEKSQERQNTIENLINSNSEDINIEEEKIVDEPMIEEQIQEELPIQEPTMEQIQIIEPILIEEESIIEPLLSYGTAEIIIDENGKEVLKVSGSPYEIGYNSGYLKPESVRALCSENYWISVVSETLGIDIYDDQEDLIEVILMDFLKEPLISQVEAIVLYNLQFVPHEYIEEMEGLRDGANDRYEQMKINGQIDNYEPIESLDIYMTNLGVDAIMTILYPIMTPLLPIMELLGINFCNAFWVDGDATIGSGTYFGRDFMFAGRIYEEHCLVMDVTPNEGNRFVSVAPIGFVGIASGMNEKGLAMGIDMCPAVDCCFINMGAGGLLTVRRVLQYADSTQQATQIIKNNHHGVSWLFPIADRYSSVTIELSAHYYKERWNNWEKKWWEITIHPQKESDPDVLITTNHFIMPSMNFLTMSYAVKDSKARYDNLIQSIMNDHYGLIDFEIAWHLIKERTDGSDPDKIVGSSISVYDVDNLRVRTLYGRFGDSTIDYIMI